MKIETIGYCRYSVCLYMFVHFFMSAWIFYLGLTSPKFFSLTEKTFLDLLPNYIAAVFFLVYFFGVSALIVLKIKSEKDALVINDKGVGSNVSGIEFKFIPWCDIVGAQFRRDRLTVITKESQSKEAIALQRRGLIQPGTIITYLILNKKAAYIVDLINENLEHYNNAVKCDSEGVHSLESYVQRAA